MVYSSLAPFYDQVMKHVNYDDWVDLIKTIINRFALPKSANILELGGGTGTLGILLKKAGFNYLGSDLNYSMSLEAKKKGLPFFCADGKYLPVKKKFDLILFLYDGINYLPSLADYKRLFTGLSTNLTKSGLFLFDITTSYNSHRYFFDFSDLQEIDETTIFRHSFFLEKNSSQINNFTIFSPVKESSTLFLKSTEHHIQKLFAPNSIKSVIPKESLTCLGVWDGFSMNQFSSSSERIHFLLQKNES